MNSKVDLTSDSRFSGNRHIDLLAFYNDFEFDEVFTKSVFHIALKIHHWTSKCLHKSDKFLKKSGIGIFELYRSHRNPYADIPIDEKMSCPRCGQNKVPWKDFCRRCGSELNDNKYSYIMRNRWPNVREPKMESHKRILNL